MLEYSKTYIQSVCGKHWSKERQNSGRFLETS